MRMTESGEYDYETCIDRNWEGNFLRDKIEVNVKRLSSLEEGTT